MKKFLLKVFMLTLYVLFMTVIFPVYVDPFNVFHPYNARYTGTEPNKNYIKMKYILRNPGKFDSFVFGSSRVGAIHNDKMPGRTYNMTYSVGVPAEHLDNLKTFLANGIHPAKIYIGIDDTALTNHTDHINQPLRCPYEYLAEHPEHFFKLYCDPVMTVESLEVDVTEEYIYSMQMLYEYGWGYGYGWKSKLDWEKVKYIPYRLNVIPDEQIERSLKYIEAVADLCRENNIELVLFLNPRYWTEHMNAADRGYIKFIAGLAEISEFYNFSGLNNITLDKNNYYETSHYKAETGDIIMNVICSNEIYPELYAQGFGMKVTRDNAKAFINMLEEQAEEVRQKYIPAN